jgi:hypothetical protein
MYQDGLWDIYIGLIVICMSLFVFRPEDGYGPWNILWLMASYAVAYPIFWLGKKFITVPRMGQVVFGPSRKRKAATLVVILGLVVAIQVGIVILTAAGRLNAERLMVSAIAALFVGPPMILIAFFIDFPRGYYIAILMTLAVFLMILLNQPLYPVILGGLIVLPGVVCFVRFLQKYPRFPEDVPNE